MERPLPLAGLLLAVLVLGGSACSEAVTTADDLPWYTDMAEARAASEACGKPILANFTGSDWCSWCIKLHAEVFSTEEFADWAEQNVVLLKIDRPRHTPQPASLQRHNRALVERYGVRGVPSILFLDASGESRGKVGYVPGGPEAWIAEAERFTQSEAGR